MATFGGPRAAAPRGKKSTQIFTVREEARWEAEILTLPQYQKLDAETKEMVGEDQQKYFLIDASDLDHIYIRVNIKLNGSVEEVETIKQLEYGIQKACSTEGYRVDITFVDTSGDDVFEFAVKLCEWPNSANWSQGPYVLSHELHHALGLDDRYDYIESHSDNEFMAVPTRIDLFLRQMKRGIPSKRDAYSKMSDNNRTLLSEDICRICFESEKFQHANTPEEMAACLKERQKLDPPGIPPRP